MNKTVRVDAVRKEVRHYELASEEREQKKGAVV